MSLARVLLLGASGQVGGALLDLLSQRRIEVVALSRQPRPARPGVTWLRGSLEDMPAIPRDLDTWISVGPLDAFAAWVARAEQPPSRLVAVSSTGRRDKASSPDPAERALARRLQEAEDSLLAGASERGCAVTVLRPTLLYGSGRDRSLSRMAAFARRWKRLPLPASACGRRQPVHVADVAQAIVDCLEAPASFGQGFDLPGGETLEFTDMVRRTLSRHAPGAKVWLLPSWMFLLAAAISRPFGFAPSSRGMLARLRQDQLADAAPAASAFGYAPRNFDP